MILLIDLLYALEISTVYPYIIPLCFSIHSTLDYYKFRVLASQPWTIHNSPWLRKATQQSFKMVSHDLAHV